ncbi:MAG: glycosyltransferase family 2 protein [Leptospira sp.]|nr:glycosyltransferase family 2 protein [Leptospira sp.]
MKLSIVIPCYNEEKNLPLLLNKLHSVINRKDIEIILVNNGSTDNSANELNLLKTKFEFLKIANVEINQGYGYGILTGLKIAKGEFLGWTHADMQTDPSDLLKALELLEFSKEPHLSYVKGNRKGRGIFDLFFTIGMSLFESMYLKKIFWDINAQPNLFHKSFFESWIDPPFDFSLDLYAYYLAKVKKLNLIRFDVLFPPRIHGHSSWNTGIKSKIKFIKRTLDFSKKLKQRLIN